VWECELLFGVAPMSRTPLRDDGVAGDIDQEKEEEKRLSERVGEDETMTVRVVSIAIWSAAKTQR
jgi:hypothetical protein